MFTFAPGALATNHGAFSSDLIDAAIFAVSAALLALGGTCRIVGTPQGLRVTNVVRVVTIDARAITEVAIQRGLVIKVSDGRRVRSFAYAASLGGDLLGYRRAHKAQGRCRTWLAAVAGDEGAVPEVVDKLRLGTWLFPSGLFCVYVVEMLVVRALT